MTRFFSNKSNTELKLREDITTRQKQVNLHSTSVADEKQLFFRPEEEMEIEEILLQKKQARQMRALQDLLKSN